MSEEDLRVVKAIADIVRTCFGPNGFATLIEDQHSNISITSDGWKLIEQLDLVHPIAILVQNSCKSMHSNCGDGSTSMLLLAAQLLENAVTLSHTINMSTIEIGYKRAVDKVIHILNSLRLTTFDNLQDATQLREVLSFAVASKNIQESEFLVKLLMEAIQKCTSIQNMDIKLVLSPGKSITSSQVIDGVVIPTRPLSALQRATNCKIALIAEPIQRQRTKTKHTAVLETVEELENWKRDEENVFKSQAEIIKNSGCNVVISSGRIHEIVVHWLNRFGIVAIEKIAIDVLRQLATSTSGNLVHKLNELNAEDLGTAERLEPIEVKGSKYTVLHGTKSSNVVTILICGSSLRISEQVKTSCQNAITVVKSLYKDGRVIAGGGAAEIQVFLQLKQLAAETADVTQYAYEAFADACTVIPRTLASNCGLDPNVTVNELISQHREGNSRVGVESDVSSFKKVYDVLETKQEIFKSATELACTIMKINGILSAHASTPVNL